MVLERYRVGWDASLAPLARGMVRVGLTPNALTAASLPFALAAAVFFFLADRHGSWFLLAGSVCVALNAILDGLDGKLARMTETSSRAGDYLDHVVDRYSDMAILLGLGLSPLGDVRWGLLALAGTFMTSYMGTQAQALGLGRNYGGWLGRADRLVLVMSIPVLMVAADWLGWAWPWGVEPLVVLLAYFAVVGNLTALQRFWNGWRSLRAPPS